MKYLADKKTHAANISKMFKKLDHVKNSLNDVQVGKVQIAHKEPIMSGSSFFNLQNFQCWSCTTTSSPDSVM